MGFVRRHIGWGSRLALMSLAIQFVLAFGHVHPTQAQTLQLQPQTVSTPVAGYGEIIAAAIAAENVGFAALPVDTGDEHRDQHAVTDTCAICAVVAMAATALFGSPPILLLPQAMRLLRRATDVGLAHLDPRHGPFQPRAPPVS
jgi:hypothetical protein